MATAPSRRRSRCCRRSRGCNIATPRLQPYVLPAAVVDPVRAVRRCSRWARRTSAVPSGRSCWSGSSPSAVLGLWGMAQHPAVLAAINPLYGVQLSGHGGLTAFSCLAAFSSASPAPKRSTPTWAISAPGRSGSPGRPSCFPASSSITPARPRIVLDGAPTDDNIFYRLCPAPLLMPLVVLATIATSSPASPSSPAPFR